MSQSTCRAIPATRRVILNDSSQLPSDYSTTPGGTLFSTTPGGTRIIYDRAFLLKCRSSPLTKSPPPNLPDIPGVTSPRTDLSHVAARENGQLLEESASKPSGEPAKPTGQPAKPSGQPAKPTENAEEPQFQLDI